jgi:hypothetical protein
MLKYLLEKLVERKYIQSSFPGVLLILFHMFDFSFDVIYIQPKEFLSAQNFPSFLRMPIFCFGFLEKYLHWI